MNWSEIPGWFRWRSAQEEAAERFPDGSRFVEVGTYLGRSLCSLGEVVKGSGKRIAVIGVDTSRSSGPEGFLAWPGRGPHRAKEHRRAPRNRRVLAAARVRCHGLELTGDGSMLEQAHWCHETCYAVTKDGNENRFFATWERGADFMQRQKVYSGEGSVMGRAAAHAGRTPDYDALAALLPQIAHEGGRPKET